MCIHIFDHNAGRPSIMVLIKSKTSLDLKQYLVFLNVGCGGMYFMGCFVVQYDSRTDTLELVCRYHARAIRLFDLCIAHNRPLRNASNYSEMINFSNYFSLETPVFVLG